MGSDIFVLEGNDDLWTIMELILVESEYESRRFTQLNHLYDAISGNPPKLIVLDITLWEITDQVYLKKVQQIVRQHNIKVFVLSGFFTEADVRNYIGFDAYLYMPFDVGSFSNTVTMLLHEP